MDYYESILGSILVQILGPFVRTNQLGLVVGETLFLIDRQTDLQRRPDVAFVSYLRWPKQKRLTHKIGRASCRERV